MLLGFLELLGLLGVARAEVLLGPDPVDAAAACPPGTVYQVVVDGQLVVRVGDQVLLGLEILLERIWTHVFETHDPLFFAHRALRSGGQLVLGEFHFPI